MQRVINTRSCDPNTVHMEGLNNSAAPEGRVDGDKLFLNFSWDMNFSLLEQFKFYTLKYHLFLTGLFL